MFDFVRSAKLFSTILMDFVSKSTASTQISTLSLHDALPILDYDLLLDGNVGDFKHLAPQTRQGHDFTFVRRSEEHTSELQSPMYLVCRLLLEKKKQARPNSAS